MILSSFGIFLWYSWYSVRQSAYWASFIKHSTLSNLRNQSSLYYLMRSSMCFYGSFQVSRWKTSRVFVNMIAVCKQNSNLPCFACQTNWGIFISFFLQFGPSVCLVELKYINVSLHCLHLSKSACANRKANVMTQRRCKC